MEALARDVEAESAELLRLVEPLTPQEWGIRTPAEPWTITDQVGHLAYFDEQAVLAITDPEAFADHVNEAIHTIADDTAGLHRQRGLDGPATLEWFREARSRLLATTADLDPDHRIPWYGPPMRARSFLVARLMETWAHGTDVADALGASLPVTDRLFHVADLGVRTFSWSFSNRGLEAPEEKVRVTLWAPSGAERTWNGEREQSVSGPVDDFCHVVSQRRHVDDTELQVEGSVARQWMEVAQVFAGPPGRGRSPSS